MGVRWTLTDLFTPSDLFTLPLHNFLITRFLLPESLLRWENITLWEKTFGPIGVDGQAYNLVVRGGTVGDVLLRMLESSK